MKHLATILFSKSPCVVLLLILLAAFSCSNAKDDPEEFSLRFIGENNRIVNVRLKEPSRENQGGKIIVTLPAQKTECFDLGFVRFFCNPYVFEIDGWESQWVVIPYYFGGGTGYGIYGWSLLTIKDNKPICKSMGLASYHVINMIKKESYFFEVRPSLIKGDTGKNPFFKFRFTKTVENRSEIIEGYTRLKVRHQDEMVEFLLMPTNFHDAEECITLLESKISEVREWAADRLKTIVPEAIAKYNNANGRKEYSTELETAVKQYYSNE
ncbi:MAG: hypothetical protein KAR20_24245 [Candidatus Heimdallarchaeota archaeon]|nr:hypothetical protein [Candidatus Heimdallarchaeota archaeon]